MKSFFTRKLNSKKHLEAASNTIWLLGDRIFRLGIGLFISSWIARFLGVNDYGTLSYTLALSAIIQPFAKLGIDDIVIKELSISPLKEKQILCTALVLKFIGSCFNLLLLVLVVSYLNPNDHIIFSMVVILAFVNFFQSLDVIDLWFRSQIKSKLVVLSKGLGFLCFVLLNIFLIFQSFPLTAFAISYLLDSFVSACALLTFYLIYKKERKSNDIPNISTIWQFSLPLAKSFLKKGLPIVFAGLAISVYMKVDQLMLGTILNSKSVGIYAVVVRLSEAWYFIPTVLVSSLSPYIYEAKLLNKEIYYSRIKRLIQLVILVALLASVFISLVSPYIVQILFGSEYLEAAPIISLYVWSSIFVVVGVASSPWFIAENLTHFSAIKTFLGALLNAALNFIWIPKYGIWGATWATILSQFLASFMANSFHSKTRVIFNLQLQSIISLYRFRIKELRK